MLPTSFGSFGQTVSEENILLEIDQSETRTACGAIFVNGSRQKISNLYRGSFIDAPYHLAQQFQGRSFLRNNQQK